MTAILGISAFYHDSAAALVVDGNIVAAAQEERFTRKKHDARFPAHAIAYCLAEAGLTPAALDHVAFYDKPLSKFERILETYLAYAPRGFWSFRNALPDWLKDKLRLRRVIEREVRRGPIVFLEHHESHAGSAFFPSPFEQAAILTLDGVGEWATATRGIGEGNRIRLTHQLRFPHSLGLLYSAFTYHCGFTVNDGEYKLMGLAPYGTPAYEDTIRKHLIDIKPDGSFRMNMDYFNYCQGFTMTNRRFARLFGEPVRAPNMPLTQKHADLAASVQRVTEDIVLRLARDLHRGTGMKHLVMAGGVALNSVANGKLLREGPFEKLWIQPAAGDAGGALGAALFVWYQLLEKPRNPQNCDAMHGSLLGPRFSPDEIAAHLDTCNVSYEHIADEQALIKQVALHLAEGKVVGWFQDRMEFGPRALGARSILADARVANMQSKLNQKVKFREGFRPFAPAVLKEPAHDWFDLACDSPYMLLVAPVREMQRLPAPATTTELATFHDRLALPRSTIPAVTHVDYSARVQTVSAENTPRFAGLLREFHALTGCPVLVNTSMNVNNEPIVCSPQDALQCFLASGIDVLVIDNFIVRKDGQ